MPMITQGHQLQVLVSSQETFPLHSGLPVPNWGEVGHPQPHGNVPTLSHLTHQRPRPLPIHSMLKIEFLPISTDLGPLYPSEIQMVITALPSLSLSFIELLKLLPHPRFKACSTAIIKVEDDIQGLLAKSLIRQSVHIWGVEHPITHWIH